MSESVNLGELLKNYEEQQEITVLDAGDYDVEIMGAPSIKGLQVTPVYKVLSGPYAGKRAMAGIFGTFNGAGGNIFVQNLIGAGLTKEWIGTLGTAEAAMSHISAALKGRQLRVTFKIEPYNNENRNKLVPGSVKLIAAPALPAVGGVPAAALGTVPVAAPAPAAAAVAAPVAPPIVTAPVAAPVAAPAVAAAPVEIPVAAGEAPAVPVAAPVAAVAEGNGVVAAPVAVAAVSQEPAF